MYDELFLAERAASLLQSVQRPYTPPSGPGAFTGFGGAVADVVPNATLTTANAWSGVLDAYGKAAAYRDAATDPAILLGKPAPDMDKLKAETIDQIGNNQLGVALREEAKKYAPDPAATGAAGQIVFGVGTSLAKAGAYSLTGPSAPVLFGADVGVNRADELKDQGVDSTTANMAGLVSGVTGAVGMKVPAAMGATRLQSAAIGAVVNPALNVAEVGGIRTILQHADYDKIAQQYQPFDPLNLTVAAVTGGAFGLAFHPAVKGKAPASEAPAPILTPDEHAAALTMHEAQTRDADTLTRPGDIAAANLAKDGQDLARQQLDNGELVSVAADVPTDADVVASRAADIAQRMNEGDTLLGTKLDFAGRRVEDLEADYSRLADADGRNLTDNGHLIDTDMVRELSPGYRDNRLRSSDIHEAASALTKELYARALARPVEPGRDPTVQFLAGGGGAGKSTARNTVLGDSNADIRVDGTLSNLQRAKSQIDAALASGRYVEVVYVFRSPEKSVSGAILRTADEGRPVPIEALAAAHEGAPQVVKTLAKDYNGNDRVNIRAIWNDGGSPSQARFIPIEEIPYVDRNQATTVFRQAADAAVARGDITPALWRAFVQGMERPAAGEGAGSLSPTRPEQHAQDPLTGNGSIVQGAPPTPGSNTIVEKVVDAVSRLLGRDEPTQTTPEVTGLKAETPEQAIAFDLAARNPDALIPSGELDADGNPIQIRAADLVQQAADVEKQAQKETAAFGAAVNCALRSPRA